LRIVAVQRLAGQAILWRNHWQSAVNVVVRDVHTGTGVGAVRVDVQFSNGYTTSCITTLPAGRCSVLSNNLRYRDAVIRMAVTSVRGEGIAYDPLQNNRTELRVRWDQALP
jgi:hypothetical protein